MTQNRRKFIESVGATALLGVIPFGAATSHPAAIPGMPTGPGTSAEEWDFSWTSKVKGKKHRALFDCAEVESGYGVWRASIWENQYREVLGTKPGESVTVLVLRHNAITLAFQQDLWDSAGIGAADKVTHPLTLQATTRNPALMGAADQVPAPFDSFALPKFMERGGVVLACNLALQFFAGALAQRAGISADEARQRSVAALVPGVILQPSGVMACVRAQQEGCVYVKAS